MSAIGGSDTGSVVGEAPAAEDVLGFASIALSGFGFLTLLRLVDRRDRTPASALGLFLVTTFATISGTLFGLVSVRRAKDAEPSRKGLLFGFLGAALGVITTALSFNWMRTRRRL